MKLIEIKTAGVTAYHGSVSEIKSFSPITYFTTRKDAALGYARGKARIQKKKVFYLYEVCLSFSNPKLVKSMQEIGSLDTQSLDNLKKNNYDAIVYDGSGKESIPEYIVVSSAQIKLVSTTKIDL